MRTCVAMFFAALALTAAFMQALAQPAPVPPAPAPVPAPAAAPKTIRLHLRGLGGMSLDPHLAPSGDSLNVIADLYEGLMQWAPGESLALAPCLASDWPALSEDGKTYTFKLREAKFHNASCFENGKGRALKASDVVASFKRLASVQGDQTWFWLLKGVVAGLDEYAENAQMNGGFAGHDDTPVEGLSAPDDRTFVLKLKRPFAPVLSILAHPACSIVAEEAMNNYSAQLQSRAVGTAPYRLNAILDQQLYILKRFEDYWGEKPEFERVTWGFALKLEAYLAGDFAEYRLSQSDYRTNVRDGKLLGRLKGKGELCATDEDGTFFLAFNMDDPVFGALTDDGKGLRKAIAHCIDRAKMGEAMMGTRGMGETFVGVRPCNELFPPGCEFYELGKHDAWGVFDLKTAQAALDATKFKGGKDPATGKALKFTLIGPTGALNERIRDAIKAGLEALGIEFEAKLLASNAFYESIDKGEGTACLYGWFLDYPDAMNILQLYDSHNIATGLENRNAARYKVKEFDEGYAALLKLLQRPENREKRKDLTAKLAARLLEDRPLVPLVVRKSASVRSESYRWPNLPHSAFDGTRFIKSQ